MTPSIISESDEGEITVKPADRSIWTDFEAFFESGGCPGFCRCMAWRATGEELKHTDHVSRKGFMRKRIFENIIL